MTPLLALKPVERSGGGVRSIRKMELEIELSIFTKIRSYAPPLPLNPFVGLKPINDSEEGEKHI